MNGMNAIRDSREDAAKVSEIRDMMAWAARGFEMVKTKPHYEPTGGKGKHQSRVPKIGCFAGSLTACVAYRPAGIFMQLRPCIFANPQET
jgi:hypothetical protein